MAVISVTSQIHNIKPTPQSDGNAGVGHRVVKADTPRRLNLSLKNLLRIPCLFYNQKSKPEDRHL